MPLVSDEDPNRAPVAKLVESASRGDAAPIEALLLRWLPELRVHVQQHVGAALRLHESGADLVQSACREALESLRSGAFEYRGEAAFRGWLFQVALNKVRERGRYHAAAHRRAVDPIDPVDAEIAAALARSLSPSQAAAQREDQERLLAAFRQLGPEQRQILQWAHFDGLAHREIAARLGTTEGNSRVLLARALARLAALASRPAGE